MKPWIRRINYKINKTGNKGLIYKFDYNVQHCGMNFMKIGRGEWVIRLLKSITKLLYKADD